MQYMGAVEDKPVKIIIERRKNSRISIGKKAIYIRLPHFMSQSQREAQIQKFLVWARNKIAEKPHLLENERNRAYKDIDTLKVGDVIFEILIKNHPRSSTGKLQNKRISVWIDEKLTYNAKREVISSIIAKKVGDYYEPRVIARTKELNKLYFRENINSISLRDKRTSWGSCSSKRNINIATRLMFAPAPVVDYVLVHELAHLKVPNHSAAFWNIVENIMPEYKQMERWLKVNGSECYF